MLHDGPGLVDHLEYHVQREALWHIVQKWYDEDPRQSIGNLCDRILEAGFQEVKEED